jgi:ABC-type branched-subunit amino acid transport system substrate-binding protein
LPAPTATPAPPAIAAPAPPTTIRIALQSPQSGEWAALGTGIRNAADLAVAQRSGPLARLGYTVEFVPFDDQSSEPQGRANAETIVADPAVLCVVGHFNSGVTIAAQPIYAAANLVQISPGSTNPSVTDDNDNVWRVVGRDDVQGAIAARFAREVLQSQRAYIIHDSTTYSRSIAQFFRQEADANGLEIVAFQSFDHSPKEIDFTPFLDEIQSLDPAPDLIFAPLSYTQGGVFFRQARARGIAAQFLGADSLDNPELVSLGGDAVSDMHFTTVAAPVSEFPQARQFAEDYRNTFGQEAPPFSPESYDAATICIEVIATAARASGQYPSREQVLDAMRTFPRFEGISGNYRFNPNGDPLTVGYYVVQVNTQNYSANRVVYAQAGEPPN